MKEKILIENKERYVIFPIKHHDIWDFYKTAESAFWTAGAVDLSEDFKDWEKLNDNEQFFIKNIISFFAASDGIVNENIAHNFIKEVQYPEATFFYGFQIAMENIHNHMYSLLIDTYIKDVEERAECFKAIDKLPIVKKKAEWALKWIDSDSFAERLIAFAAVEGIFFSGSFCSIFWLKTRGLMPGLCKANSYINKDEALHTDFAVHLYNNHIENKLSEERIKDVILSAYEIEKEFITDALPVSLIGMNHALMTQYIQFVTDQLLIQFKCKPVFNVSQPFDFMMQIAMKAKQNFFEGSPTEYKKADLSGSMAFDEEF